MNKVLPCLVFFLLGLVVGPFVFPRLSSGTQKKPNPYDALGFSAQSNFIKKQVIVNIHEPPFLSVYEASDPQIFIKLNTSCLLSNGKLTAGMSIDCILLRNDTPDRVLRFIDELATVVDWEKNGDPRGIRILPHLTTGDFDYYVVLIRESRPLFEDIPTLKIRQQNHDR
jgi:hypothetical protein